MTYDEWIVHLVAWVCTHPTLSIIGVNEVSTLAYLLSEKDRLETKEKSK